MVRKIRFLDEKLNIEAEQHQNTEMTSNESKLEQQTDSRVQYIMWLQNAIKEREMTMQHPITNHSFLDIIGAGVYVILVATYIFSILFLFGLMVLFLGCMVFSTLKLLW